jgi:hypothetical protein
MTWGSKLVVALEHPYILAHHPSFSPSLHLEKERGVEKGENEEKMK